MSKIYFRYGAMNCGKSTALMQVAHNYEERGLKVILLKPEIDTKGANHVVSRLNISREVDYSIASNDKIKEVINLDVDCILVDEVQFLSKEQVDELFEIAVTNDIPVICYGLRSDFLMNGFEGSTRLLEIAHSIEELKTICRCGRKATINGRKINGEFVFEGSQVAIDGEDNITYESLCAKCFLSLKNK